MNRQKHRSSDTPAEGDHGPRDQRLGGVEPECHPGQEHILVLVTSNDQNLWMALGEVREAGVIPSRIEAHCKF
jgi:hypothetical protein